MPPSIGPYRASTIHILLRIWAIFTAPIVAFVYISGGNWVSAVAFWGGIVVFCMLWVLPIASLWMRLVGPIFWGDDWHYFRQSGGRPLLDALPWPFNPVSRTVRHGGLPEPRYSEFVPPPSWEYQCPSCGAMNAEQHCVCWHCHANWINGWGEGSTQPTYERQAAPIDRAIPRERKPSPTVYHDAKGQPYCVDDDGRFYWWYADGRVFYYESE